MPVGHEPLQAADAHGFAADGLGAVLLALGLLVADTAADGGQVAAVGDDLISAGEVALSDMSDELGDALIDRAALGAGLFPALQAPHGLADGVGRGVPELHLVKVFAADFDRLLGHGISFSYVVNHFACPSFGSRLSRLWIRLSYRPRAAFSEA